MSSIRVTRIRLWLLMTDAEVSAYTEAARARAVGLPREALGSLAVDEELLIALDAYTYFEKDYPIAVAVNKYQHDMPVALEIIDNRRALNHLSNRAFDLARATSDDKDLYLRAAAEVRMWSLWRGEPSPTNIYGISEPTWERIVALSLAMLSVVEKPARLPYVVAGITNVEHMDRCISGGVDPALSHSLVA